jgi:anti-sigma factor ChrR (cupin superfamily)
MSQAPAPRTDGQFASRIVDVAGLPWLPTKFPGIEVRILMQDEATGLFTALFKWSPGAQLPLHEHVETEQSYVLEGSFEDDDGEVKAGNYVSRPPGSRHAARSKNGALVLAMFLKPNIFLNPDGTAETFKAGR